MALPSNFFAYPLINTALGCNADGVDPTEILNYLIKKQFSIPNTRPYTSYGIEQSLPNISVSYKDYNYSQYIPPLPPTDIYMITTFSNYNSGPNQAKYVSSNYPYMAFYSTLIMNAAANDTSSNSFMVSDTNKVIILTQNALPINYGINTTGAANTFYKGALRVYGSNPSTGNYTQLSFGSSTGGSWLFDTDAGILTFYDRPTAVVVSRTIPPRISFWRYEGLIGNNAIMNVQDF